MTAVPKLRVPRSVLCHCAVTVLQCPHSRASACRASVPMGVAVVGLSQAIVMGPPFVPRLSAASVPLFPLLAPGAGICCGSVVCRLRSRAQPPCAAACCVSTCASHAWASQREEPGPSPGAQRDCPVGCCAFAGGLFGFLLLYFQGHGEV